MKHLVVVLIVILAAGMASAEEPSWRTLEMQFREMPMEARRLTGPLFWLHGDDNETKERLEMYLGKVAEGHNGSFCTESRPHSDWLGPRWYQDLDICLQRAKQLDLKMWIFDERWWPSQTVAGRVPPEYGAKVLDTTSIAIDGPKHVSLNGFDDHFVAAIAGKPVGDALDPDSLIDLKSFIKDGTLNWDAPQGKWLVMTFTWALGPNARQKGDRTVDGASQDCVDWFLQTVYQPHYDRFKDDFGKTIVGFFYDEPETQGDWGTELSKVFAERGIDEKKALVAWKFKLAGDEQIAARYAYIDALGEAWGRTMYGSTLKWCEDRGVDFIGHFMEHHGLYLDHGLGAINLFQMQKYNTMGGMDLVCQQLWPGERRHGAYQLPKLTSSISHAYGKKDDLAMTEIFGAYGQGITYPQMKWLCDWHQVRGVNFMITHSFNPKAPNDTDCPPYFYNGGEEPRWPLYRVWADYTNRLSLMLTGGKHVCPIAFLFCGQSKYVGKTVTPEGMTGVIQDALYDCDWIPYEVFDKDMGFEGLALTLRDERYKVLIVPPVEAIPYPTLQKVKAFFDNGGIVLGYDFLPSQSATLGRTSTEVAALVEAVWGSGEPGLEPRKTTEAGGRSYLLPANTTPKELVSVLAGDSWIEPVLDVHEGETDGWLHVLHRVKSGRDVYFICNQQHEGEAKRFIFRASAHGTPERWDPMRNEITAVSHASDKEGLVEFSLTLEPMESALIIFNSDPKAKRPETITTQKPKSIIPVKGNAAEPKTGDQLNLVDAPWVWYPEGDPKAGAPPGTRWFRREITLPDKAVKLGRFILSADNEWVLYVNGQKAGQNGPGWNSWQKPKEVDIAKLLKPGVNVLAIEARNTTEKPSPAGLIGRYSIGFESGDPVVGSIDGSWKASEREAEGWMSAGFDDSAWPAAKVIAGFGDQPWGNIGSYIKPANPFKGTCVVSRNLDLKDSRVYLEMENLEEGASVKVNGRFAGGLIGRPFRLDVTKHLRQGSNTIEIEPYAPESVRLAVY